MKPPFSYGFPMLPEGTLCQCSSTFGSMKQHGLMDGPAIAPGWGWESWGPDGYPLVMTNSLLLKMAIYSGFTNCKL